MPGRVDFADVTVSDDMAGPYGKCRAVGLVPAEPVGGFEFQAILGYQAVRRAATDPGRLSSSGGVTIPPFKQAIPGLPAELDPPEHLKYRRLLVPELRPERIARLTETIRREADRAIDQFGSAGQGDLAEIARHVPPAVIGAVLGVPDDGPLMVDLTRRLARGAILGDAQARASAEKDLMAYLDRIVTDAEDTERTDLLGTIANAVIDGEPIGHIKAVATVLTLVVAGQSTTVSGIGSILALLATRPDVKQALIVDPALIPAAVEETLRLETPVQVMGRTITDDTEIEGCPVKAGDRIGLGWGPANLDPAAFENPGEFRLNRSPNPHLAFGHGVHRCVGEHLARAEMTIATEQVLGRLPNLELAGPLVRDADSPANRGLRSIPVRFTPSPRVPG